MTNIKEDDDKTIIELVKKSPPFVQKKIIQDLVKLQRTKVLDILCDDMRMIAGV